MKLIELNPQWKKVDGSDERGGFIMADGFDDAECILILCPLCFQKNKGAEGTHSVFIPNPKMKRDFLGGHARWEMTGNDFNNLTVNPSVLLKGTCDAHFWIKNGEIITC